MDIDDSYKTLAISYSGFRVVMVVVVVGSKVVVVLVDVVVVGAGSLHPQIL